MIPTAYITEWRQRAPWPLDAQVEQDLLLTRALVDMYALTSLQTGLAFRGGTALHKLHFDVPGRYSEDIDLVQVEAGPIGPILDEIRSVLDAWLGEPTWRRGPDSAKLIYRFQSTVLPVQSMRLKIEINTREHFSIRGMRSSQFRLVSRWHDAEAQVTTYDLEEILATKLRALYQRKKGRDLYDLWLALDRLDFDAAAVVDCFAQYMERSGVVVTRAQFESNLAEKLHSRSFCDDVVPLLREGAGYDVAIANDAVRQAFVSLLPGLPWKGAAE